MIKLEFMTRLASEYDSAHCISYLNNTVNSSLFFNLHFKIYIMVTFDELANEIFNFRSQLQDFETEIYIVAGVLGGACAVLLLCFFIMICVVIRINKSIKEVEENKRVAAEINARKFSAYTGEEVHRRLKSAVPQEPGNSNSEYAFNHPVNTNYAINNPPAKF